VAYAWADPAFRAQLLLAPGSVLESEVTDDAPSRLIVLENKADVSHLVIPLRPSTTYGWPAAAIRDQLTLELEGDKRCLFWLPSQVIADTYCNPSTRIALLRDPNSFLAAHGYDTQGRHCVVVENTATVAYLPLPFNYWEHNQNTEDLDALEWFVWRMYYPNAMD
jgi:hypothetical protein